MNLVDQLNTLRTAILTAPHGDGTFEQWKALEPHLTSSQQNTLLWAWNAHLKSPSDETIVHSAFAAVIHQLQPAAARHVG